MQPLAGGDVADRLVEAGKSALHAVPLNSENFWKKKAEDVAAEDVFFHQYFNRVNKDKVKAKKGKGAVDPVARDEEDIDDIDGISEDEDQIWKALVDSRPDLEADDDSDDDLDLDDLDSAYDDEEDEGEADGDDEVIFNDESDVPSDEVMEEADFDGFDDEETAPAPAKKGKKSAKKEEPEDDEDAFDMDVSDEEAFLDSDDDLPSDMELGGVELPSAETAPSTSERKKRRKLKHLPTFASADDYAALLGDEDEGM
jgi:ribosome biogenesis protein MAK21